MSKLPGKPLVGAAALCAAIVAIALVTLGGGEGEPARLADAPPEVEHPDPSGHDAQVPDHGPDEDVGSPGEGDLREPPGIDEDELTMPERAVARTVRAYVDGLDERDSDRVCRLLAPGAIDAVELPRKRESCAASLSTSIGYRDPRGLPVWDGARVHGLLRVELDGDRASVTATTITRFADRDQRSVEDDVIHLRRDGGRWLIAKASSTLYRAVGIDEVPLDALTAPD